MIPNCPRSLRTCISCCPMHRMYSGRSEVALMPKFSCGRWVNMLAVLVGMLQIFLVSLLIILSSFLMSGLENGTA